MRTHLIHRPARDIIPPLGGARVSSYRISRTGVDFSPPILQLDYTFLVPAGSSIQRIADADRTGVRIAAVRDHASSLTLSRILLLERAITAEFANRPESETTRNALIAARLGQGKFRQDLEKLWGSQCALSSVCRRELLRASHIKPWSASNNVERLDPYNGLLLAVGYDVAFDKLLITLDEYGELLFAPDFSASEASAVGIIPNIRLKQIHPQHLPYLEEHRARFKRRATAAR
jgi:HNH endonuclease